MAKNRAWLLNFGKGLNAAVASYEMSQIVLSSDLHDLHEIPCMPHYCNEVFVFQDTILPVIDIPNLLEGDRLMYSRHDILGLAAYQTDPSQPVRLGGIHLAGMPLNIFVEDEQMCDLDPDQEFWRPISHACFRYENQAIPILNVPLLFSEELALIGAAV